MTSTKRCSKCGEWKELDEFHNNSGRPDGKAYWCKVCQLASNERWKKSNPEAVKSNYRTIHLRNNFGITTEEFEEMSERQGNVCAICKEPATRGGVGWRLSVDHHHSTGRIRGLLCDSCNVSIGRFKDSPTLLRKAADYLEKHT